MNTARRMEGKKAKPNYLDVRDVGAFSLAILRAKTKDPIINKKLTREIMQIHLRSNSFFTRAFRNEGLKKQKSRLYFYVSSRKTLLLES